uniref:hypothetical protein n=1 Tax=Pelagibacter ubique TaxID=198252 RepID=UPI000ABFEA89
MKREFSENNTIESLIKVLEPAMKGRALSKDELITDIIFEEAGVFSIASQILITENGESTWEKFKKTANKMDSLYPDEQITQKMQEKLDSKELQTYQDLTSLMEKARGFRINQLKRIYTQITSEQTKKQKPKEICHSLTIWINTNKTKIQKVKDTISVELSNFRMDELDNIIVTALKNELD